MLKLDPLIQTQVYLSKSQSYMRPIKVKFKSSLSLPKEVKEKKERKERKKKREKKRILNQLIKRQVALF